MAKVDGSLKSLIQGVSQQPPRSRLAGQCTLQENFSSNPVTGLTRRPPLEWISDLFDSTDNVQFYHLKQGSDDYVVCALDDSIKVFTLAGEEKTVNEVDDAYDYLDGNPLVFTTLEDQTIIANTHTTCAMLPEFPTFIDYGPIVYVRGGNYGTTYTVTVTWKDAGVGGTEHTISASYTTSSTDMTTIQTVKIATELKTALDAVSTSNFNTTFDVTRVEDVLYIQWKASTGRADVFSAVASDTAGNNNCVACNNDVKTVSLLPRFAPHGYFVRVSGDGSQSQDDYYLEYSVTPDDQGVQPALGTGFGKAGIWIETVKNKIKYLTDWDTLPHTLTYDKDTDEFSFGTGVWGDRIVGDEDSNPSPSFIGRQVTDLSYFQGRLVILAGPAVCMSKNKNVDNAQLDFWIETVVRQNDTDPIDVQSTAQNVTRMLKAIPNNRDLVVFADNAQFVILGRNTVTPANSSLVLTTSFEANLTAAPVPAGRNIFFAINYGQYTGIREFFTADSVDINDSRPITQHVLKYIEGGVEFMASTSNFDTLLVKAGAPRTLYVYEYIWKDDTKVQSSWSKWLFPSDIYHFFWVESVVYVISKTGDSYIMERIDLNAQFDTDMEYQVKLDRKNYIEDVNFTLDGEFAPHVDGIDDLVFVQGTGCPYPGMLAIVDTYDEDTGTVTFTTDMQGGTVIVGLKYKSRYRPTMPMVKDQEGVKVGTGNLIIGKFYINCQASGSMEAIIVSKYYDDVNLHFSGRVVGDPNTVIGVPAIADNRFVIPFRDNADNGEIEFWTDSHEPLTVMDIEWVGQYTKRGQRIVQGD